MMEGFPFLWNEDYIITSSGADFRDAVIESATEEIARYGGFSMLSWEDDTETVVTNLIRQYIRYESIRKKRFTKS